MLAKFAASLRTPSFRYFGTIAQHSSPSVFQFHETDVDPSSRVVNLEEVKQNHKHHHMWAVAESDLHEAHDIKCDIQAKLIAVQAKLDHEHEFMEDDVDPSNRKTGRKDFASVSEPQFDFHETDIDPSNK